jgi:hypothetical protein
LVVVEVVEIVVGLVVVVVVVVQMAGELAAIPVASVHREQEVEAEVQQLSAGVQQCLRSLAVAVAVAVVELDVRGLLLVVPEVGVE